MGQALSIRDDLFNAAELRILARRSRQRRAATRMLAIANALDGMSRAAAARLVGLERQALRDAVTRYNAEGLAGLYDRAKPGRPPTLTEGEQATLRAVILRGPEPEQSGGGAWTLPMLSAWIAQTWDKHLHPDSLSRVLRRLDLSRQKTRPVHPRSDEKAKAAFEKRGCAPR
jgi:transposase